MNDPTVELAAPPASEPELPMAPAAASGTALPDVIVDVICPTCGTPARINAARRSADDFCIGCDLPLFWTVERTASGAEDSSGDNGLRRLPGTAGRAALAFLTCPVCTEPNSPSAVNCTRCRSLLRPTAVSAPVVIPVPVAPIQVVAPRRHNWWLIGLSAAALLALIVLGVVLLLND